MTDEKKFPKFNIKSIISVVSNQKFFPSEMVKADPQTSRPLIGVRCPLCLRSVVAVYQRDGSTKDKCGECGYALEDITWKPLIRVLFERTRFETCVFWLQTQVLKILRIITRRKS